MTSLDRITVCKNGHLVAQVAGGFIDPNPVCECQYCGSTLFHYQTINPDNPLQVKFYEPHLVDGEAVKVPVFNVDSLRGWTRKLVTICGLQFKKFDLKKGQVLYRTVDKKYSIQKVVGEEVYLAYKLNCDNDLYIWMSDKKFDNREKAVNFILEDMNKE